jgi:hypothetical protein
MSTESTKPTTRTISLTNHRPVKIVEEEWPVIAQATDKDWDYQYECQANRTWSSSIRVRQHADKRAIVYARYEHSTQFQGESGCDLRHGQLLDADADIIGAINSVAGDMRASMEGEGEDAKMHVFDRLASECIADLPAEQI